MIVKAADKYVCPNCKQEQTSLKIQEGALAQNGFCPSCSHLIQRIPRFRKK